MNFLVLQWKLVWRHLRTSRQEKTTMDVSFWFEPYERKMSPPEVVFWSSSAIYQLAKECWKGYFCPVSVFVVLRESYATQFVRKTVLHAIVSRLYLDSTCLYLSTTFALASFIYEVMNTVLLDLYNMLRGSRQCKSGLKMLLRMR